MPRKAKPFLHQGWYYTTAGGSWVKLCPDADGFDRAARLLDELRADRAPVARRGSTGATLGDVRARYLEFARRFYLRHDGTPSYEVQMIGQALNGFPTSLPIAQFSREHVRVQRDAWVAEGLQRGTINDRVRRVKRWLRWALDESLVPDAVVSSVALLSNLQMRRTTAPEAGVVLPATASAVAATLPEIGEPWASLIRLQWHTGMRPAEACGLLLSEITVRSSDEWVIDFGGRHKSAWRGHASVLEPGAQARTVLAPWILKAVLSGRPHLFVTADRRTDKPPTAKQYGGEVRKACVRLGVAHWTPNQLRHSYATRVRAALGLDAAGAALRHKKLDVTQLYAERDRELQARVARRMG